MGQIRIVKSGVHSSVQDFGRAGHQSLGVPEGGALDRDAMRLANILVGNREEAAVLEVCMGGLAFETLSPIRLALAGTTSGVLTIQDGQDGHGKIEIPAHRSFDVGAGRVVRLGMLPDSNTASLALLGGIDVPPIYGSRATSPNAMIGGVEGRLIQDGDILNLGHDSAPDSESSESPTPELTADVGDFFKPVEKLRVVIGPDDHRFKESALEALTHETYKISPSSNRMGMRLEGKRLEHSDGADILSAGIITGSIQVAGDGQPIILMADHQTTGGYTRIATVISADLPALGRLRGGMAIGFEAVSLKQAEDLAHRHEDDVRRILESIQGATPLMDTSALYLRGDTT